MSTVTERVARGAALLDEKIPGWDSRIDLDVLDIDSCAQCILGQVFAAESSYYPVARGFGAGIDELGLDDSVIEDLGFDDTDGLITQVSAEWRRVITERRVRVPTARTP